MYYKCLPYLDPRPVFKINKRVIPKSEEIIDVISTDISQNNILPNGSTDNQTVSSDGSKSLYASQVNSIESLSEVQGESFNDQFNKTHLTPEKHEPECLKICPEIIPRSAWKPRRSKKRHNHLMNSVPPVVFKSTTAHECTTKEECLKSVKWMQNYHMEIFEMPDIAHSFVIGQDGNVYEGRGWGYENDQGPGFVGIAYMGHYTWDSDTQPTRAMRRAAYRLIMCGVQKGFIKNPFKKGIKTDKSGVPDPEMWDKYLLQNDDEY